MPDFTIASMPWRSLASTALPRATNCAEAAARWPAWLLFHRGRKLGRIFVENGWVTEVQIAKTVARQLRVPYQDLSNASVRADVARLLPEGQARRLRAMVLETGPEGARVAMADPTDIAGFDEIGRLLKREYGPWMLTAMRLLARLKFLRGGALDIFGRTEERRMERALIGEYQAMIERVLAGLTPARLADAVALAASVDQIRGFGHVKHANVTKVREAQAQLLAAYEGQAPARVIEIRRAA